jgi:hypothetical protein
MIKMEVPAELQERIGILFQELQYDLGKDTLAPRCMIMP